MLESSREQSTHRLLSWKADSWAVRFFRIRISVVVVEEFGRCRHVMKEVLVQCCSQMCNAKVRSKSLAMQRMKNLEWKVRVKKDTKGLINTCGGRSQKEPGWNGVAVRGREVQPRLLATDNHGSILEMSLRRAGATGAFVKSEHGSSEIYFVTAPTNVSRYSRW